MSPEYRFVKMGESGMVFREDEILCRVSGMQSIRTVSDDRVVTPIPMGLWILDFTRPLSVSQMLAVKEVLRS
jgi:hypothetical protein